MKGPIVPQSAKPALSGAARILRNSAFSFIASLVAKAATTLVFILIARKLTVREVGIYSLALTYNAIFMQVASWGLDQLLVREVARQRERVGEYLINFTLMRLVFSLLSYGGLVILVWQVLSYDSTTAMLLSLAGLALIFDSISNLYQAVFVVFEDLTYITYTALIMGVFKLGATYIAIQQASGATLPVLVGIVVGASGVGMLFNLGVVMWRFMRLAPGHAGSRGQLWPWGQPETWWTWARQAFPFVFVTLFYTLDYQLDVVLLSAWQGETAVGVYGAATTVLFALLFISQAIREAIFPVMARFYPDAPDALRQLYRTAARWLLALALPIAVGGTWIAEDLMVWIYSEAFRKAGGVLQIIIWSVLFLFMNVPNARLMVVAARQGPLAWFAIASMSVNLLLNVRLIPAQSYVGAAIARVASATVFFVLIYAYTHRYLLKFTMSQTLLEWRIVLRPLAATAVLVGFLALMQPLALVLRILVSGTGYALALWATGFISPEERSFVKDTLKRVGLTGEQRWIG